jgi:hypothetical protein
MSKLYRTVIALFVTAGALIAISGIPALKDADGGWEWIVGGSGWFGGLLLALIAIGIVAYGLVRAAAHRRRAPVA